MKDKNIKNLIECITYTLQLAFFLQMKMIKFGSCVFFYRLLKEKTSYEVEVKNEEQRLEKFKSEAEPDEYKIKKQVLDQLYTDN